MALSDCSSQAVWISSIFSQLGFKIGPIQICGDNQGSIFISNNPVQERRSKHIDVCYHYIRELVEEKKIDLKYIPGSENPADMFTKNLGPQLFEKFRRTLGLEFYPDIRSVAVSR